MLTQLTPEKNNTPSPRGGQNVFNFMLFLFVGGAEYMGLAFLLLRILDILVTARFKMLGTSGQLILFPWFLMPQHFGPSLLLPFQFFYKTQSWQVGTPPGRQTLPPGQTPSPPVDGYCSGRYASYWNAFLLLVMNFLIYFTWCSSAGNPLRAVTNTLLIEPALTMPQRVGPVIFYTNDSKLLKIV